MSRVLFVSLLIFSFAAVTTSCQRVGCPDSLAVNYDPEVQDDDGSCVFPSDLFLGYYDNKDTLIRRFSSFPDSIENVYTQDSFYISIVSYTEVSLHKFSPCVGDTILCKASSNDLKMVNQAYNCNGAWKSFSVKRISETSLQYEYTIEGLGTTHTIRGVAQKRP